MILKIVEGVSSKDTFHVAKTAVNLSIFSKLPFFNYNFLKLPQKLKKPLTTVPISVDCSSFLNGQHWQKTLMLPMTLSPVSWSWLYTFFLFIRSSICFISNPHIAQVTPGHQQPFDSSQKWNQHTHVLHEKAVNALILSTQTLNVVTQTSTSSFTTRRYCKD